MTPEARERILDALALEHRSDKPYDERDAGHAMHPARWTMIGSTDRRFLGAAARAVIGLWAQQTRVCVCKPTSRPVYVDPEEGSTCFRCSGRVVPRAPFRAGEWE